ncbi:MULTISPECIES: DUF2946 domain-containing protein [Burkholderia cepacia complex]|uniref:DUF2946 domain-containing protein n=1 Tax=Burkholderia cepacia complex TaxID=87882 RepID=UPI00157B869B|nr:MULTISPECIES: DUF2946 domain-containing protein [Burkholderia cepacia complex]NTY39692.1 DUF2946 domain-containing protein [Burkholderia diffusa]
MSALFRRRIGSILGLLAILMATLAPTISQSLSSERQFDAVSGAFCTAQNGADVAGPDHASLPAKAGHWQACAYCGLLADMPALPGGTSEFVPTDWLIHSTSAPAFQTPHSVFHFAAAQPRAPPFSS